MKLEAINDPRAMQLLSSMAMELGALETATVRIRAQVDMLFDLLAAGPAEAGEVALSDAESDADGDGEVSAGEAGSIGIAAEVSEGARSEADENAEAPHSEAGIIVLCARIEASVAEFAAGADVACASADADVASEAQDGGAASALCEHLDQAQVTAGEVSDVPAELDNEVTAEAGGVATIAAVVADEVLETIDSPRAEGEDGSEAVACIDQAGHEPAPAVADVAEETHSAPVASEPDAVLLPTAESSNVAESAQGDAAVVAKEDAPAADNVVPIKLKRRVWPQRLAACASVLLIAAAGVVVAMPELVWIYI